MHSRLRRDDQFTMGITSHNVFAEFEEYEASIKDANCRMTLTSLQRRRWEHTYLQAGDLHIQRARLGGGYVAEGALDQTGWVFYLNSSRIPELANGAPLSHHDVYVIPPGAEASFSSLEAQDWEWLFISTSALCPTPEMEAFAKHGFAQIVAPGRDVTRRLRAMVRRFTDSALLEPTVVIEQACVDSFSEEATNLARHILGVADMVQPDRRLMRPHALCTRATEMIEDRPDMSPTIGELAKTLDVSIRGLQLAFAKHYGISPHQYLCQRRLTRAHAILLNAEPEEITVRAAAAKVGFWDFGRFAQKYRALFAELPSETLSRRRSR